MAGSARVLHAGEPVGRSLRAQKTGELIAAYLRARIVRGELREGDSLPAELELMEQFEVSRPTLREAFRILETESLIVIRRGSRGARVTAPDVRVAARYVGLLLQVSGTTLGDVYQARTVLEPPAAAMLARRRTARDLADLTACVDRLEALIEELSSPAEVERWAQQTLEFHDLVLARAGNQTLAIQSAVLQEVTRTHLSLAGQRPEDLAARKRLFRRTTKSYRKLIALVEAGDPAGAEKHWSAHMEAAGRSLLQDDLSARTVLDLFA
jgi:GntR family transcriptional regulator, transcriptional repressor for pyruvate dehydrogenase complex